MGFGCPICSEQLHRLPAEAQQAAAQRAGAAGHGADNDINISATPCGHLFHTYCIQKWLTGAMQSSKQCPCCRKNVPGGRVLPLYPNGFDESILDDSQAEAPGPCDHSQFRLQISGLQRQIKQFEATVHDTNLMLEIQKDSANDWRKKYEAEKILRDRMTFQWKQYESYKDFSEEKERECKALQADLLKYQIIDSMVKGSNDTVEEELQSFPPTDESTRTLLEMIEALKRELQSATRRQNDTKKELGNLRAEKTSLHAKLAKKQRDYDELRRVYDNSLNVSLNHSVSEDRTAVAHAMHHSRTPLLMASKVSRKLVTNYDDEPLDEDVPLIQPFAFKNKALKSKKPSSTVTSSSSLQSSQSSQTLSQASVSSGSQTKLPFKKSSKNPPDVPELESRKRKPEDGAQKTIKKIQKTLDLNLKTGSNSKSDKKKAEEPAPSTSTSKSVPTDATLSKINKLTKVNFAPKPPSFNNTIQISDSDSDETDYEDEPLQLRGNIPGMKVTPQNRPKVKSAAGRALLNGPGARRH